ncbi:predicted protein [Bathycoccus prasinos]|uniref:Uncharacterized protein n=1 Tax=Bathycoccus prasinos TaxID=41875 RepID=K8F141_9CHLO|nr:predicted protein [Bathycoccus prasinos]CCO18500.1 predicted protein [Bathycoccus prasinos]|eukprot:XP_007510155.1 predicted protein [Bathycoccus prasinos]
MPSSRSSSRASSRRGASSKSSGGFSQQTNALATKARRNGMMRKNVSSSAMSEREMCSSSTSNDDVEKEAVSTRRNALLLSACATAFGFFTNAEEAEAAAPAEFAEETLKMINMTKDILNGKDYDQTKKQYDPAKLQEFEEYRTYWFDKYQYQHGKSFYGYANTWNAQAKVAFQVSMSSKEGAKSEYPNGFDPESTAYNKAYLIKILDKAEDEIKDYESRNAF